MRRFALLAAAVLVAVSCASGGKLRESAAVVRSDIDKARKSGAMRCAPKDARSRRGQRLLRRGRARPGPPERAQEHMKAAEKSSKDALRYSKTCAPTQVVIKKAEEKKIEMTKVDRDGDGVPDVDDLLPRRARAPAVQGLPRLGRRRHPRPRGRLPARPGPEGDPRLPGREGHRRRRHPRRHRSVPARARGQGRLPGRGRLPRSGQRRRRHPRQADKCPNEAEDRTVRGRGRLPGSRQRRRRRPRRRGQVPERGRARRRTAAAPTRTRTATASSTGSTSAPTSPARRHDGCPKKYSSSWSRRRRSRSSSRSTSPPRRTACCPTRSRCSTRSRRC